MIKRVNNYIESFLNNITMYRLVLYFLIVLLGFSLLLSLFGALPFNFIQLLLSACLLVGIGLLINIIFAKVFDAPTNVESIYITALILALIINPATSIADLPFLLWAIVLSTASKFILAVGKKHIFNPAAVGIFLASMVTTKSATWWIGTIYTLPVVLLGGLLITKKIKRMNLVLSFFIVSMVFTLGLSFISKTSILLVLEKAILYTPWLFFAFIMLTEPLTTPPTFRLQVIYAGVVGFLFSPKVHFGSFYTTPELALLIGNIYSYSVSPKNKLLLKLRESIALSPSAYDFVFNPGKKLKYLPGQYMEWTLGHKRPDNRGNRRYFTLASSPTENEIRIGVKFYKNPSSYKKELMALSDNKKIVATQLAGDFVMPKDISQKLVFIAGGIGITPFRSMIKYLVDTNQKRLITLFYSNNLESEIVYRDVFNDAVAKLGIKVIYTLTDTANLSANWQGKTGFVDSKMIVEEIPDYKERTFYISGPRSMVAVFEDVLSKLGVKSAQIKTDFFPGYA